MIQTQLPLRPWEQQNNLAFYSNAKKFEVSHFLRRKFAKFLQNGNTLGGRRCFVSGLANQFFAKVPTKLICAIKFHDVITLFLKIAANNSYVENIRISVWKTYSWKTIFRTLSGRNIIFRAWNLKRGIASTTKATTFAFWPFFLNLWFFV